MKKPLCRIILPVLLVALSFAGSQRGGQSLLRPDLAVAAIDFRVVKSGTDSQGNPFWTFNVTAGIKNQGNGNAGPFQVLLERNDGPGGSFQAACPTCRFNIPELPAGGVIITDSRQFNNANGAPSKFRFTVDSAGQVDEGNELNNSRTETFSPTPSSGGGGPIPPHLRCDIAIFGIEFRDISTSAVNGKTMVTLRVAATVKNNGPGPSPECTIEFRIDPDKPIAGPGSACPALDPGVQRVVVSPPMTFDSGAKRVFQACLWTWGIPQTNTNNDCSSIIQYPPNPSRKIPAPALR
jgi:hypothetical protein